MSDGDALRVSTPVRVADDVHRWIAPNPGVMTGPGTNGYFIGDQQLAMIDPGPAMPGHIDDLVAFAGGRLKAILVTHTHRDHSPAAMALAEATGATVYGMLPPPTPENDAHFKPDVVLAHHERVSVDGLSIQAIHTPGHASNHLCFLLESQGLLFTGDHIMNGSTVVIAAPDGNMADYLRSLAMLKTYPLHAIAPGHGALMREPNSVIDWIIDHRLQREAKVVEKLAALAPCDIKTLLPAVYDEVDPKLWPIARYSLLAHLEKLAEEGRWEERDSLWHRAAPT